MVDWRKPESENEKCEMIGKEAWGSVVNTYLWYEVRDRRDLVVRDRSDIVARHFAKGTAGLGDIECHRSQNIPGNPWLLCLRGELVLLPAVMVGKFYFPLYQIGHIDGVGRTTPDYINFWKRMDPNARASGNRV